MTSPADVLGDSHLAARVAHLGRLHRRSFLSPRSRRQAFRPARPGLLLSKPFETLHGLDSRRRDSTVSRPVVPVVRGNCHTQRGDRFANACRSCGGEPDEGGLAYTSARDHSRQHLNTLVASDPLPQLRLWRHSYRAPLKRTGSSGFRPPVAIRRLTSRFIQFG